MKNLKLILEQFLWKAAKYTYQLARKVTKLYENIKTNGRYANKCYARPNRQCKKILMCKTNYMSCTSIAMLLEYAA